MKVLLIDPEGRLEAELAGVGGLEIAGDPEEGLERLRSHRFDACVLVVPSPAEGVAGTVARMRRADRAMAVLLVTGERLLDPRPLLLDSGADQVVELPRQVLPRLKEAVTRRRERFRARWLPGPRRVLVVDPGGEIVTRAFSGELRRAGFSVESAYDATTALFKLRESPVHVLLAGLEESGLMAAALRYDPSVIPVAITAELPTLEQARRIHDFLLQPVTPRQVIAVLERALAHRALNDDDHPPLHGEGLRVLLVAGGPEVARQVQSALPGAQWAREVPANLEGFDVILVELGGLDTLVRVRSLHPRIPALALCHGQDAELAALSVRCGAQDCLVPDDLKPGILAHRIRSALERHRLMTRLERFARYAHAADASRRKLIDCNADAILVVDPEGQVLFANPAAEELCGRRVSELVGAPFGIPIRAGADTEVELTHPRRARRFGQLRVSETEWEGHPAFLVSIRDVTEEKRTREELRRANAELARSNAELERFAYAISHDLLHPLQSVSGYLRLARDRLEGRRVDETTLDYLERALAGADRMQAMIEAVLAYSRLGSARPAGAVDASAALDQALENLRGALEESRARVTRGDLPRVVADPAQLVQVFQNLVGNAVKYRGKDPPRIHVDAEPGEAFHRFFVADNGIGLDPARSGEIFRLFGRLEPGDGRPGAGVGLAICQKIVESHGGEIGVTSEPGRGAVFHFTLPAGQERAHPPVKHF